VSELVRVVVNFTSSAYKTKPVICFWRGASRPNGCQIRTAASYRRL